MTLCGGSCVCVERAFVKRKSAHKKKRGGGLGPRVDAQCKGASFGRRVDSVALERVVDSIMIQQGEEEEQEEQEEEEREESPSYVEGKLLIGDFLHT